jgi:hypothetical protein
MAKQQGLHGWHCSATGAQAPAATTRPAVFVVTEQTLTDEKKYNDEYDVIDKPELSSDRALACLLLGCGRWRTVGYCTKADTAGRFMSTRPN